MLKTRNQTNRTVPRLFLRGKVGHSTSSEPEPRKPQKARMAALRLGLQASLLTLPGPRHCGTDDVDVAGLAGRDTAN